MRNLTKRNKILFVLAFIATNALCTWLILSIDAIFWDTIMKKYKEGKKTKTRNWLAVHAFQRSGAGKHKSKKNYTRKIKHKGQKNDD